MLVCLRKVLSSLWIDVHKAELNIMSYILPPVYILYWTHRLLPWTLVLLDKLVCKQHLLNLSQTLSYVAL